MSEMCVTEVEMMCGSTIRLSRKTRQELMYDTQFHWSATLSTRCNRSDPMTETDGGLRFDFTTNSKCRVMTNITGSYRQHMTAEAVSPYARHGSGAEAEAATAKIGNMENEKA